MSYPDRFACFLPAISGMYADVISRSGTSVRPLPVLLEDLDFLNPKSKLFHLEQALYSAGQAAATNAKALKKDFVTTRKPNCTLIGDSGGFQVQTGAIAWEGDVTRHRILTWLEANCDWSMCLDFPTGSIDMGTVSTHRERITNQTKYFDQLTIGDVKVSLTDLHGQNGLGLDYNTCLYQTLFNNNWFVEKRTPGKTKILNVLQGRDERESVEWYNRVKHFPFEGWAFAGKTRCQYDVVLRRLLEMRRDGLIEGRDWYHFLGIGTLENACVLTTIQECLRNINPTARVSFDVSSPFLTATYGEALVSCILAPAKWSTQSVKLTDLTHVGSLTTLNDALNEAWKRQEFQINCAPAFELVGDLFEGVIGLPEPRRFHSSSIGDLVTMSDICLPPDCNAKDRSSARWDQVSYAVIMNHNVDVFVKTMLAGLEAYEKDDELHVSRKLLRIKALIREIFSSSEPEELIEKNLPLLRAFM